MSGQKMHDDEVDIHHALVRGLVDGQFPEWRELPIELVHPTGTVNAMYRLGRELCVRLPRVEGWARHLQRELTWLPKLAPQLSLAVPKPVANGAPTDEYPFAWAVYEWIDGESFALDGIDDEPQAAVALAEFVAELRRVDPAGGPRSGRDPIAQLDAATREAIESVRSLFDGDVLDRDALCAAWQRALQAPSWEGSAVWRHCDLLPPNLLMRGGQLVAVIDFGGAGIGDPAADVIAAWSVFGSAGRDAFRGALDVDDGTWARARAYALHQALLIIPYYPETNPHFVAMAIRTVQAVLADLDR